jgi:ribosomal protein L11 methyltransferase
MWWALSIAPVRREELAALGERLFALGASGLQEEPVPAERRPPRQPWEKRGSEPEPREVVLTAWFDADADRRDAIAQALGSVRAELTWSPVEERDWEAEFRASVQTLRVGPLVIAPPWAPEPGALLIEPGLGFGTGDHPTTRQALTALVARVQPGSRVLDVGCGSGILGLAAAHLGAIDVLGVDVEAAAVREARRTAELNGSRARFEMTPVARVAGPWPIVVANLHAELIASLAPQLRRLTGEVLILAGILADREQLVHEALGWAPTTRAVDGEWVCWQVVR